MSFERTKIRLDQVSEIRSGKRLPLGHTLVEYRTPFPYIRLVDVKNGSIQHTDLKFLTSETRNCIQRYVVNSGDVCLAIVGHTIGMVFYVQDEWNDANLTENAARLTNVKDAVHSKYLYYFLSSEIGQAEILSRKVGSAQGKLPLYNIRSLEVDLPPRREQNYVVELLDALESQIDNLKVTNATLEAIAQALFKSWFVDFDPVRAKLEGRPPEGMDEATASLFPDGFEKSELGLVPRGWRIGIFDEVALLKGGKQLERTNFANSGANPVFGGAGEMGRTDLSNADGFVITVGRVGAYCGQFFWHLGSAWVNNNASHIKPRTANQSIWIFQWLKCVNMELIKKGAAQPFVSNGDIAALKIALPPDGVVSRFVEIAEPIFRERYRIQEQAQTLATLRDTLLPRLISGQLRLPKVAKALS